MVGVLGVWDGGWCCRWCFECRESAYAYDVHMMCCACRECMQRRKIDSLFHSNVWCMVMCGA